MFALLLLAAGGDPNPPAFVVDNKMPPKPTPAFVVNNKTPAYKGCACVGKPACECLAGGKDQRYYVCPTTLSGGGTCAVSNQVVMPVTVPTDLSKLAPPGWKKVKIGDGPWHFEKDTTAPGVAAPNPFGLEIGTPGTIVQPAGISPLPAPARGSSAGQLRPGTSTSAPRVILSGGTNCPNGNCPYR